MIYSGLIAAGEVVEKGFNKDTINPLDVNTEVLLKILRRNSKSEIGKRYNFGEIKSVEEYKEKLPLSSYIDYEEDIERMTKGEKNVLVKGNIEYFGNTSGTTGKQKLIPVTKNGRLIASKYMALLSQKFYYNNFKDKFNYQKGLMIADTVMTTYTDGGIPICSATSGGMKKIKSIIPYMYTSPYEVMQIKNKDVALFLHLLFALKEVRLLFISGVFISNVLDLFRVLEDKNTLLVRDIRRGVIGRELDLDDDTRKKLNNYIKPNAGRADELEREFIKGFNGICRRIWPELAYLACVTGSNFSIYDDKVNYYTNFLPIYSTAYGATEAMIGINPYANKIMYVVIPDNVFYEFISIKDEESNISKTYCINELKINECYEIVVTNHAGLYRYRLGDVVKVVGFYNNSPEIEFLYRKNQVLNMVSEKTTEEHLTISIKSALKNLKLSLIDYTTLEDNSITPGRYIFFLELKEKIPKYKIETLEKILDLELQKSNLAYGRFRNNKRLDSLKVKLVKENTFNIIKERLLTSGISKNQIKIPRVITKKREILEVINLRLE